MKQPFKVIYHDLEDRTEFYDNKEDALADIQQVTLIAIKNNAVPELSFLEFRNGAYHKVQRTQRALTEEEYQFRKALPTVDKSSMVEFCSVCGTSEIAWVDPAKIALIDKSLWKDQKHALGVDRLLRGIAWVCLRCNQLEIIVGR